MVRFSTKKEQISTRKMNYAEAIDYEKLSDMRYMTTVHPSSVVDWNIARKA